WRRLILATRLAASSPPKIDDSCWLRSASVVRSMFSIDSSTTSFASGCRRIPGPAGLRKGADEGQAASHPPPRPPTHLRESCGAERGAADVRSRSARALLNHYHGERLRSPDA